MENTQRKREHLVNDPEAPVRLHPCDVVLNIALETPDQPTYSLWVATSVKGFGHISRTERYILEIPFPLIINSPIKIYNKIYQEALAKQSQALHLALVLSFVCYLSGELLSYIGLLSIWSIVFIS